MKLVTPKTRDEYVAIVSTWPRKDILSLCRAVGLTAHKIASNEDLAGLLWDMVASKRKPLSFA